MIQTDDLILPTNLNYNIYVPGSSLHFTFLPLPASYDFHTVTLLLFFSNEKLFKVLIPSHLPSTEIPQSASSTSATRTPCIPPWESIASLKPSVVATSCPSLMYLLTCPLTVAALRSHAPFSP